jgi:hypothetical protein
MGAEVTIDKHTSGLEDWLDIHDKLESITYEEEVCNHVAAWRFFADETNPQEFNTLAVDLDLQAAHQLVSPHDAYLVYAIRNFALPVHPPAHSLLPALLNALRQNIDQPTYLTPIVSRRIDSAAFYVYAYLGKLCKPKIRLVALSYALKVEKLLNSRKKLAILSGGGVLRNKKLQRGSTLPLLASSGDLPKEKGDCADVHVVRVFWEERQAHPVLDFKARRGAFIECEEVKAVKTAGVKPPMLKLSLKPFEEVSYAEIEEEQKNGEIKFDIRATARHELKMEKFEGECS